MRLEELIGGGGVEEEKEKEKEKKRKKKVLVGIRFDQNDRLLLNWTLLKVAEPGDHVVVLHVCEGSSDFCSEENLSMDGYLEVYKGLCTVKQLDLTGQVSRGSSVRKVLVREAKLFDVSVVVVGINNQNTFGGWLSTARYCAKRLSQTTTVLAVHNGKVVYRGICNDSAGTKGGWRFSVYPISSSNPKENKSISSHSDASEVENSPRMAQNHEDASSVCSGGPSHVSSSSIASSIDIKHDNHFRLSQKEREKDDIVSPSSVAEVAKEVTESKPGWPLLRVSSALVDPVKEESEARKMSVVQWVMSLPSRSHSSPHADQCNSDRETGDFESLSVQRCFSGWGSLPKEMKLLTKTGTFSYEELRNATSQFSSANLIGDGGCSHVYKGVLSDGKLVAIKVLKVSKEGWREFVLEIDIVTSLKHRNITPLLGLCLDDNELILVYDFMPKGNLEENLHGKKEKSGLAWEVRFNVAIGIAEAINYLHNECPQRVIHRDIKSSNILLSETYNPRLSDFGLAIWAPTSSSHETGDVVGTFGYLAPEYFMYGKVSNKIDVYSFGVVLLELLTGRKPISSETPKGQESLVMWAKPILESGDISSLLDPKLDGKFDENQVQRMVLAVTLCITRSYRLRPEMNKILELLKGDKDIKAWVNTNINGQQEFDNHEGDEAYPDSFAESHLSVALLDVDDATTSFSSVEQSNHYTLEDYLKGRCSRSSSFD